MACFSTLRSRAPSSISIDLEPNIKGPMPNSCPSKSRLLRWREIKDDDDVRYMRSWKRWYALVGVGLGWYCTIQMQLWIGYPMISSHWQLVSFIPVLPIELPSPMEHGCWCDPRKSGLKAGGVASLLSVVLSWRTSYTYTLRFLLESWTSLPNWPNIMLCCAGDHLRSWTESRISYWDGFHRISPLGEAYCRREESFCGWHYRIMGHCLVMLFEVTEGRNIGGSE